MSAVEPTQAEVVAFTEAWEKARKEIGRGIAPKGTKTRAGLTAAFAERESACQKFVLDEVNDLIDSLDETVSRADMGRVLFELRDAVRDGDWRQR